MRRAPCGKPQLKVDSVVVIGRSAPEIRLYRIAVGQNTHPVDFHAINKSGKLIERILNTGGGIPQIAKRRRFLHHAGSRLKFSRKCSIFL